MMQPYNGSKASKGSSSLNQPGRGGSLMTREPGRNRDRHGADALDVFDSMRNQQMRMFEEFDSMSRNMFGGFGGSFGSISNMMRGFNDMMSMDNDFGSFGMNMNMMNMGGMGGMVRGGGDGAMHVVTKSYVQSTKKDANGRDVTEKYYQDSVQQKAGNGPAIGERRQAYQNTGSGVEKIGHERILDDKGRKVVKERVRGQPEEHTYNYYNNMQEEEGDKFMHDWTNAAKHSGFGQARRMVEDHGNALSFGRPLQNEESHSPGGGRNINIGARRANDLMATQPNRRPLALPAGPGPAPVRQEPRRNEGVDMRRPDASTMNNNGVYRNKNPANVMPKQG